MDLTDLRKLSAEEMERLYPAIKRDIAEGMAAIRAGDTVDGEAFFDELEREEDGVIDGVNEPRTQ